MSNKTNTIGLTKPMPGSRNWGQVMNNNLDAIDQAFQNSNNKIDYVSNTLNSLNYLDIQEGEDWCVIGRAGLINIENDINGLTCSEIQTRDTIDSEEGCFYIGTIIGNGDNARFKASEAFTTSNISKLTAYNNYRGFYLFYSSSKSSSWKNLKDDLFDKLPWDPSFQWQTGEIVVKKPYIKQNEPTKITFTKFTQALGGYYIPEQIDGSTDLKFKKALYHEAKDEQIVHFPAGFMDATYSETTLVGKQPEGSDHFEINLNDQLANSNISDYSNVEVKFFENENENENSDFCRKQVMFEYNIEYNPSDKKYYCIITPHTTIDPSKITARFISYRKVNKLTFAAYFSEN